ncbi:zf-HC2 domain-containing protein [Marinomonas balearica]|uniref:Putative zinc finger protein n=1 Tax=Marinomonas balearica TaxID=491947 RepID=A0A4R6MAM9_9GAMM|nr:zf-HC2 domain-containing protein [Marinomonas balearica]TDO97279.1 putative zinc finger protein [Marinomonas balearica]
MMMKCTEATQMLSERLDRKLSTKEKLSLGMHTAMCSPCRQFGDQMKELREITKVYKDLNNVETKE